MRSLLLVALVGASALSAQTQLTVYNRNFAAVKERRVLDLAKGQNEIRVTDITAHLEPESVVLRHLRQPDSIRILEQNYESDPLSEGLLLRKSENAVGAGPAVTERAFEEYHLYTLERPATVLDREIKQVEFVRAANVPAARIYVYDGFKLDPQYRGWNAYNIRTRPEYGSVSNPKVWAMLEFRNSAASRLGMPLPKGKVKVYRRDVGARDEFIGEDQIDHTPSAGCGAVFREMIPPAVVIHCDYGP